MPMKADSTMNAFSGDVRRPRIHGQRAFASPTAAETRGMWRITSYSIVIAAPPARSEDRRGQDLLQGRERLVRERRGGLPCVEFPAIDRLEISHRHPHLRSQALGGRALEDRDKRDVGPPLEHDVVIAVPHLAEGSGVV